ncbi:hypothetical protein NG800_014525 [Epilithonimonas ginsengisoli]|uniref:DUF2157 domain-containing protein n=1 Tax=Epilithonimonas ginsengisoli TaxID=1245592 RepID=A0ABU4JKA0_9FLAO|nr:MULTISPECIES: hypothetical protein [Chryseobacterium group]MBV6881106.1 hypothetical protein [Epilithonimonas sp. FP105]MDW8550139.1 hypothetical protein [Epilithonimonas ginsengisoli]OAH71937.1 hypothetical protein AXA65_11425 [Chryseobacterium sp. FP211-J200]
MVSKKVIEKLSNKELNNYIKPESKFVAKSIRYAFDILKERGNVFSETEAERIEQLIQSKEKIEAEDVMIDDKWDKNLTEDQTAIKLYSNKVIWVFSVIFGVVFGTALQVFNFFKVNDKKGAIVSLIFGISYALATTYLLNLFGDIRYGKMSLRFLLSGIGALGLYLIREKMFKSETEYRAKSFITPLVISLSIHLVIIYFVFFES